MRTPEQQAAFEAAKRMSAQEVMLAQIAVLQCAVRALIISSPNPDLTQTHFDQLFGQMLAYPGAATSDDMRVVLKDLVETIFRPPGNLDA
jgi:hypothetical protein